LLILGKYFAVHRKYFAEIMPCANRPLWQQFSAAIAMLENALLACPETLWQEHLWIDAQTTLTALSTEKAHQQYTFPWPAGATVSYFELLLYTMRHVQEHAAQLSLFLGQHAIPGEALNWVQRAKEEAVL
jgi:hypothetical protein